MVEPLSPMALPDAQASASSVFGCFVSLATVTSSADRFGTIDLPFRRASVGVFSMVEPLSPMALPDAQASESSGFRLFCLTSHSHFKRRSIRDNRSTISTRKRRSLLHGRAIVPNGSIRRASVGVFGFSAVLSHQPQSLQAPIDWGQSIYHFDAQASESSPW